MADDNQNPEGGSTTSAEQLAQQVAQLTAQLEAVKPVLELTQKYGVTPEQFAAEAQGAFGALVGLQEAGILDRDGKIVVKEPQPAAVPPAAPVVQRPQVSADMINPDQIADAALQKISPKLKAIEEENSFLRTSLNRLYREKIADAVKQRGYEVDDEDINLSLAESQKTGGDFWEALDRRAERYKSYAQQAIEKLAKEHNLDLSQLNKIKDLHSKEGGVSSAIVEGKIISRKPGLKGANVISARDATAELFRLKGF